MPIYMLHSNLRCENQTISKMMAKHTTEFWSETRTSTTQGFLLAEKSNENSLQNPLEHQLEFAEKISTLKDPKFPLAQSDPFPTKFLTLQQSKALVFSVLIGDLFIYFLPLYRAYSGLILWVLSAIRLSNFLCCIGSVVIYHSELHRRLGPLSLIASAEKSTNHCIGSRVLCASGGQLSMLLQRRPTILLRFPQVTILSAVRTTSHYGIVHLVP